MGIKNEGTLKRSWFVLTDEAYKFSGITEDYDIRSLATMALPSV